MNDAPPTAPRPRLAFVLLHSVAIAHGACIATDGGADADADVAPDVASLADTTGDLVPDARASPDTDPRDATDAFEPDGSDLRCDPAAPGALCECTTNEGRSVIPGMLGPHVFCCDARDDRPWACNRVYGHDRHLYWFDMSRFGAFCGGLDFPLDHALDRCPWEE